MRFINELEVCVSKWTTIPNPNGLQNALVCNALDNVCFSSNGRLPPWVRRVLWTIVLLTKIGLYTQCGECEELDQLWASYQIRKIAGCACSGNAVNVFPATDLKGNRLRDAHVVMHVEIANPGVSGKKFPAFPAHAQPAISRIWQEAHCHHWNREKITFNQSAQF